MKLSDALGVTSSKLWGEGVFDSHIGIDSRLHVDPALLRGSAVPELKTSANRLLGHFGDVLKLLVAAQKKPGGMIEGQARKKLVFPEIKEAALGYAVGSNEGTGLTGGRSDKLAEMATELVAAGVDDPEIFEIAVLFQEGIGADLISDMTLSVIASDLGSFNARVCRKLRIPSQQIVVKGKTVALAHSARLGRNVLLIPYSLLSELPEAASYADIGTVVDYNSKLREELNQMLGARWAKEFRDLSKRGRKRLFLKNPELLHGIVELYRSRSAKAYDFEADPLGEVIWEDAGKEAAGSSPLRLAMPRSASELRATVLAIARQFKRLIEENAACDLLYVDGKRRPEKFAQLLFYSVSDSYCKANDLDLSAEPNAGQGPVDFKVSSGYEARAAVELKLSDNSQGLHGMLAQLPRYARAEQARVSCFVLIVVGKNRRLVDQIVDARNELIEGGKPVPDLVVVNAYDAFHEPSASNPRF